MMLPHNGAVVVFIPSAVQSASIHCFGLKTSKTFSGIAPRIRVNEVEW